MSKIFIFDFDGTIADTHQYIIQISNQICGEFHYATISPDEVSMLKDKTTKEVIRHLNVPMMKIPAILARAKKEFHKDIETLQPIADLKDVLLKLKTLKLNMGILSSNSFENIDTFLKLHHLQIFDFVQTTSKVWSKNTSLKKLLKKYNLKKEQIIYVGDEIRDIVASQRLDIPVIAVGWGYNSIKALKKYSPDFIVETPQELFELCTGDSITKL